MGKQANPRTLSDSEAKSVIRNLRVSPQKLNLIATMIRGMDVNKAIAALTFHVVVSQAKWKRHCSQLLQMLKITVGC